MLRYPALNQQWLCILSFVRLRIVSLELKKGKKEKKARVFLKSPIFNSTNKKLKSSIFKHQEGGYTAAGPASSPSSGEELIASGKGPGWVCAVHWMPFRRRVSWWNSPCVLKAGQDRVRAYLSEPSGWPTSSLTVPRGNSRHLCLCSASSLYLIEYQARKIKIKPTNLRPAAKPK